MWSMLSQFFTDANVKVKWRHSAWWSDITGAIFTLPPKQTSMRIWTDVSGVFEVGLPTYSWSKRSSDHDLSWKWGTGGSRSRSLHEEACPGYLFKYSHHMLKNTNCSFWCRYDDRFLREMTGILFAGIFCQTGYAVCPSKAHAFKKSGSDMTAFTSGTFFGIRSSFLFC